MAMIRHHYENSSFVSSLLTVEEAKNHAFSEADLHEL